MAASEHFTSTGRALKPAGREPRPLKSKSVVSADMALRRAVLARLVADPLVRTGHLGVAAIAGRVTLSGYVTSNAQKEAASAATRRVSGVQRVTDEVRVAVPCPDAADPPAEDFDAPLTVAAQPPFRAFNPLTPDQTGIDPTELRS